MRVFLFIMIGLAIQNYASAAETKDINFEDCMEEQMEIIRENAEDKTDAELESEETEARNYFCKE